MEVGGAVTPLQDKGEALLLIPLLSLSLVSLVLLSRNYFSPASRLQHSSSTCRGLLRKHRCRIYPQVTDLDMTDFVFMEKTHPNKMLESLNRLRLKEKLCDVTLRCGGKEFPCHRIVLASFSSYFEAMFTTAMMESRQDMVDLIDVEPQVMEMLLSYAYTSEVVSSSQNVQALLAAAHLLNVTAVQEACCHYMESHMDEKNCVGIHCLADTFSFETLEKLSMDYILKHFSVVYQQEEFLSLSVDKLTEILASDHVNVTKEEMMFEAAMLWLNHSPERKQSFVKVMEHIRLALLTPSYLDEVKESLGVVESQACQRLLSENKNHRLRWATVPCEVILMVASDRTVESFDPQINRWKTLAPLPFRVDMHALVASGSTVYLAGGMFPNNIVSRELWSYDYSCDSWLKMADMTEARSEFALVMLDGCVFAVGGYGSNRQETKSVERYNPSTNTWHRIESVGMPNYCLYSVIALDGFIYATGWRHKMYKYNPKTSVWTEAAPMLICRQRASLCTFKGKIYVIGGQMPPILRDQVECYDPETDQWSMCPSMKRQRKYTGVAVVDGLIYVLGGMGKFSAEQDLRCIEAFNDQTDTWDIVGEMPALHSYFRCVSHSVIGRTCPD